MDVDEQTSLAISIDNYINNLQIDANNYISYASSFES